MSVPEPEMNDPEDLPPEDSEEAPPPPSRARPEWLVGAEEGVASEWTRTSGAAPERPVQLRLVRPEEVAPADEEADARAAARRRLHLMGPDENVGLTRPAGKPLPKAGTVRAKAWAAAASSVPTIKRSAPTMPEPKFNRLQDGDPENLMSAPLESVAASGGMGTGLGAGPGAGMGAGVNVGVGASLDDPPAHRPAAPAVTLAPLKESPWMVVVDALLHNRQLQMLIGLLVVAFLAWTFWPRGESNVSVSRIRHHPELFDGQTVRIHGKIGDVYAIAGGYTFYLLSGRDTMVVFTRSRVPLRDDNVSIRGTISTGYLDGVPRQALFEDGKQ